MLSKRPESLLMILLNIVVFPVDLLLIKFVVPPTCCNVAKLMSSSTTPPGSFWSTIGNTSQRVITLEPISFSSSKISKLRRDRNTTEGNSLTDGCSLPYSILSKPGHLIGTNLTKLDEDLTSTEENFVKAISTNRINMLVMRRYRGAAGGNAKQRPGVGTIWIWAIRTVHHIMLIIYNKLTESFL